MQILPKVWRDGDGGRQPVAFPGSHVPELISVGHGHSQQVQVTPLWEHPEVPLETLGVRNSVSVDLSELGGGTLPPCGWRMKLNVTGESKITNSSAHGTGEGDAVSRQKHTEKERVEKRVTRK